MYVEKSLQTIDIINKILIKNYGKNKIYLVDFLLFIVKKFNDFSEK